MPLNQIEDVTQMTIGRHYDLEFSKTLRACGLYRGRTDDYVVMEVFLGGMFPSVSRYRISHIKRIVEVESC